MGSLAATCLLPCLAIASAAAQQQEPATVRGRAIDRDGKPVAGCAVGVFVKDEAFDPASLLAKPTAITDAAGCYRVDAKRGADQVVVVATKGAQICVLQLEREDAMDRGVIDALMLPGGKLSGRVRDAAGKPLAGALIRVDDPLPTRGRDKPKMSFQSWARSDERGIFEVPGVPRTGLRVTASAPGFPGVSRLAAHDSPLDLTLVATGLVRGRVLDADGKPVPGRVVDLVTLERRDSDEHVRTDGEGRFTITAPNAFRFRVTAHDGAPPYRSFTSGVLHGPTGDVDVKQVDLRRNVQRITIHCVDAATKAPIEDFHASMRAGIRANIADAVLHHAEGRRPFRGEATFEVSEWQRGKGMVVVDAKGYGFAAVTIPKDLGGPLVAELPAECTLTGRVIDPLTGKPAAGSAVRALPDGRFHWLGGGPDPWRFGAVTDADGRYHIGGLAPGNFEVQAYAADRGSAFSTPVTIAAGARATLDLELEAPRFLEFELVGEVPAACLGSIWIEGGNVSNGQQRGTAVHRRLPLPTPVSVNGPRRHKLGPVDDREFRAKLLLPTRGRLGSALTIDLGVIDEAGPTKLQLPDLRTVAVRGRVRLPADLPPERVAILANRQLEAGEGDWWSRALARHDTPFAACLGSDASFAIDVPQGRYLLQLVDLETGIVFHTDDVERPLNAATAREPIDVAPAIRWLTIDFVPATGDGPVVVQGIVVKADCPADGLTAFVGPSGASNNRQNMLVPCPPATPRLRWLVPPASLSLDAIQSFGLLSPTNTSYEHQEVGHHGIDANAAELRMTFRIPPPPDDVR